MKLRSILAFAGATLAFPLVLAAPAHAAGPPLDEPLICREDNYVHSCFEQDGDDIWVKDVEKDGRSAVVAWETSYGRKGECKNSSGFGTWHECKFDLWEGDPPGRTYLYWEHWTYDAETKDWNYISGTYSARISSRWLEPV